MDIISFFVDMIIATVAFSIGIQAVMIVSLASHEMKLKLPTYDDDDLMEFYSRFMCHFLRQANGLSVLRGN